MSFFKEISKICENNNLCWGTKVKIVKQNKKLGNIKDIFEILTIVPQNNFFFTYFLNPLEKWLMWIIFRSGSLNFQSFETFLAAYLLKSHMVLCLKWCLKWCKLVLVVFSWRSDYENIAYIDYGFFIGHFKGLQF